MSYTIICFSVTGFMVQVYLVFTTKLLYWLTIIIDLPISISVDEDLNEIGKFGSFKYLNKRFHLSFAVYNEYDHSIQQVPLIRGCYYEIEIEFALLNDFFCLKHLGYAMWTERMTSINVSSRIGISLTADHEISVIYPM